MYTTAVAVVVTSSGWEDFDTDRRYRLVTSVVCVCFGFVHMHVCSFALMC